MAAVTRLALLATLAATILPNSVSAQLCSEPIVHRNTRFVNGDQLQVNTTVTFAQCVQLCCDVDGERRYDLHRILQSARCSRTRASRPLPRVARGRRHSQCACCTRARSASSASSSNWPAAAPIHGRNPRSAWICASETRRLPMPCSERRSRAKRCKLPSIIILLNALLHSPPDATTPSTSAPSATVRSVTFFNTCATSIGIAVFVGVFCLALNIGLIISLIWHQRNAKSITFESGENHMDAGSFTPPTMAPSANGGAPRLSTLPAQLVSHRQHADCSQTSITIARHSNDSVICVTFVSV